MPKLPESAARFSDAQMREEPELVAAAVRYARAYVGDWDVMRAAKQLVHETGTLPVAVARTVANCARADPRYVLAMNQAHPFAAPVVPIRAETSYQPLVPDPHCPHIPHHLNDGCQKPRTGPTPEEWPHLYPPADPRHRHDFNSAGYCRNRACDYEPEEAHGQAPVVPILVKARPVEFHTMQRRPVERRMRLRFKHRYYWSTHRGAYRTHILDPRESYGIWRPDGGVRYQVHGWCHSVVSHWTTGNTPPPGRDICRSCERAEARAVAEVAAQLFDTESKPVVSSAGQEG